MNCAACNTERDAGTRLPRGWKRLGESAYCGTCWRDRYVLRAVTIPVSGPKTCEWPELREALKTAWIQTTQASNWMMRQLALADPGMERGDGKPKLAQMPRAYLYPEARRRFPDIPARSISSLEQAVQGKYRKMRWDLATCQVSLPSMRYPVPMPVHNQAWWIEETEDGELLLSVELPGGRQVLRLRGGHQFRRQRVAVRKLIAGDAVAGECAIYRVRANGADHRNGDTKGTRVMAKMVMWLPRDAGARKESMAAVHTGGDALLTVYDDQQNRVLVWNESHLWRRVAAHDRQLGKLREDLKAERRVNRQYGHVSTLTADERERGRREQEGILARMDLLSANMRAYLHDHCHRASAMVAKFLVRRRCAGCLYVEAHADGSLPHFPWHKLKTMLADKLNGHGIEMVASDGAVPETPEPLEETG